jgi:tungstate transport system ATP-binding protein
MPRTQAGIAAASNGSREALSDGLRAEGLCFEAGGRTLIDIADLAVRPGRCTIVTGANGSGKSLLLRLLHGLIRPSSGTVFWQGRPLDAQGRRSQAMVFQRPVMLRRSVRANLRFALGARGFNGAAIAAREAEALEIGRLAPLAGMPARVLSGGEQQRLAMVRALACEPQILFLDEPTSNLDPSSTQAIENLVREALRKERTVVLVTHDSGQARRLGDDMVFLHEGRIAENGPVEQVLAEPRSQAVRAWLEGRLYLESPHHGGQSKHKDGS